MNAQLFDNLLSWSAQISILATAGAAGAFKLYGIRGLAYISGRRVWQSH